MYTSNRSYKSNHSYRGSYSGSTSCQGCNCQNPPDGHCRRTGRTGNPADEEPLVASQQDPAHSEEAPSEDENSCPHCAIHCQLSSPGCDKGRQEAYLRHLKKSGS